MRTSATSLASTASAIMNLIELAIFFGFPACLAFCYLFPLREGLRFAFAVGVGSAIAAAIALFLFGAIWRLFRKHWPHTPVFAAWSCIAISLTSFVGILAIRQSRMGLLGLPATAAALLAVVGPRPWRKVAWVCFGAAILASAALRAFTPFSRDATG